MNQYLKKSLIISASALMFLSVSAGVANVNGNSVNARTVRTSRKSSVRNFGYHLGMPRMLNNTYWHGKPYAYNYGHLKYGVKEYSFLPGGYDFSAYYYNSHNKIAGGSAGSGSWWNPFYKYVGHHTYKILSGDGTTNGTKKTLRRHDFHSFTSMITTVKILNKHQILINGHRVTKGHFHAKRINHKRHVRKHARKHVTRRHYNMKRHHNRK